MPTWTGAISTDWNTAGNWTSPSTVPTAATAAIFTGTPTRNCTTGTVARACLTLDTTGYLGTLEIGSSAAGVLNVSGNVTIGNSIGHITGLAYLQIQANSSLNISSGVTLPNLSLNAGTVTMLSNVVVNNFFVFGFRNLNGAFDLTINGNAQGGTVINATTGRKVIVTASSTGTSTLTTFSINNFIFEIDCSNRNISLTGISIYTTCTINYLATNTGGFTTTGHTLRYSTTSINMFSSTNSWNIISANASSTLTLLSDVYCVQFGPTLADTINGIGFFICAITTGALSTLLGNAGLRFVGASNGTWNQINTNSLAAIVFAKTNGSTVSIPNNFTYSAINGIITYTSGLINHTATLTLGTSITLNTPSSSMSWNSLTIPGAGITTLNSPANISNNLTLGATGNTAFTGSGGWTCANLLCSTANRTLTLANSSSGASYRTTSTASLIGTNAQRITMTSNNATTQAIWTLDNGAQQSLVYVNGTRIDSSQGATIWSFGGTLVSASNWATGSAQATTAYTYVC
jgi:hypothetical protein